MRAKSISAQLFGDCYTALWYGGILQIEVNPTWVCSASFCDIQCIDKNTTKVICLLLLCEVLLAAVLGALLEDDALHEQEEPLVDAVRADLGGESIDYEFNQKFHHTDSMMGTYA